MAATAQEYVPNTRDLELLKVAARSCQGCPLYKGATQIVFGEGTKEAVVMLIGEQPGDQEDQEGRPFVGPAGKILRSAMAEVGLIDDLVYITNAVKHFKWIAAGSRRLHQKPNRSEIRACRPWLEAEIESVKPKAMICLGSTAAQSVIDKAFKLTQHRGEVIICNGIATIATLHPSAILRMHNRESREEARRQLAGDLRIIQSFIGFTKT